MNNDWALQQLQSFLKLTAMENGLTPSPFKVTAQAAVVEKVVHEVIPDWVFERAKPATMYSGPMARWSRHREGAARAAELISRAEEIQVNLGDGAPQLSASGMHPWIWDAARSLWQSGHHRQAVAAAATKLNAEVQNRVGRRDISDAKLMQEAFSMNPATASAARLRVQRPDDSETYRSAQVGVMNFAAGCFQAIRNLATHERDDLPEQEALERLAALSLVARWIEAAEVERGS